MFSHIMIGSNDIEQSKRFYDAVLGTLGASEPLRNQAASGHTRLFYRHEGSTFCISEPINGEGATCANGSTIGFKCSSPEQVQKFHDTAVAHGGISIEVLWSNLPVHLNRWKIHHLRRITWPDNARPSIPA